jgi:hypothetical protein
MILAVASGAVAVMLFQRWNSKRPPPSLYGEITFSFDCARLRDWLAARDVVLSAKSRLNDVSNPLVLRYRTINDRVWRRRDDQLPGHLDTNQDRRDVFIQLSQQDNGNLALAVVVCTPDPSKTATAATGGDDRRIMELFEVPFDAVYTHRVAVERQDPTSHDLEVRMKRALDDQIQKVVHFEHGFAVGELFDFQFKPVFFFYPVTA